MEVFIAYTEKGAPVGISKTKEETIERIKKIEKEYKYSTSSSRLIGRKYFIQKMLLVTDKVTPENIIRTIPLGRKEEYESGN